MTESGVKRDLFLSLSLRKDMLLQHSNHSETYRTHMVSLETSEGAPLLGCLVFIACVCVFFFFFNLPYGLTAEVLRRFQKFFSHITTVSGCDRELNAHVYSAASLKY